SPLSNSEPLLIAPLDPIIYDRRVTEQLWAFDYRWEVYVPPQKRHRGYYALPLLNGTRFTGHADLKADREVGKLQILSSEGRSAKLAAKSLAAFLGLRA
ncbi:MAG: DNA glycosylase AlkZ-like family protein, partial [Prosthecobacter sp.]